MPYSSKLLQDGRYGIYVNNELAATIACPRLFQHFMKALEQKTRRNAGSGKLYVPLEN